MLHLNGELSGYRANLMPSSTAQNFKHLCRQWRKFRKLSQLDLALAAEVSQRHVSWLETGRSHPSRDMVMRLSDAMDIPLRERNTLLQAAGYAAAYSEMQLDDPAMTPVLEVLNHVLQHHDPLPAVVVDRLWNVKKHNQAASLLFSLGGNPQAILNKIGADGEFNLALLTLHPEGLRQYISNWEQVAPSLIRRLKSESLASNEPKMQEQFTRYLEMLEPIENSDPVYESLLPFLPLELDFDGLRLSLFSVISTFGTPQDITTDELRIEAFYPTDAQTEEFFHNHIQ